MEAAGVLLKETQVSRFMFTRLFILLFLASISRVAAEPLKLSINSEAAILINADTGVVLFQKNPHVPHYPASITKIGTAMWALKKSGDSLDVQVTAEKDSLVSITEESRIRSNYSKPAYWLVSDGAHMGIKNGETMSLRNLICGLMVVSGNDAANVIANYVSGSVPKFVEEMNDYFKTLGCKNTVFMNPHGLHDPKHKTTAYDMSLITKEAMKNPTFREFVSTVRYLRPKTNKQAAVTMLQTNRLLRPGPFNYPKAIGVKTGHHSKAQQTFVAAAKQPDGRTLIAVLLRCKERNLILKDAVSLFDAAFNQPKVNRVFLKAGEQKFELKIPGADKPLHTFTKDNLNLEYYPAEDPDAKCFLYWSKLTLPIKKGDAVGELKLKDSSGNVLKQILLYATEDIKKTWFNWMKQGIASVFQPGMTMYLFWGCLATGAALTIILRLSN